MTDKATQDKAREVTDRLLNALPKCISAEMDLDDWGDPYGTLMSAWFALNDAAATAAFPTHHTFVQSTFGADDEADHFEDFLWLMQEGTVEPEEIVQAHKAFDTAHHALTLLGMSY
jgi:hypothetical protein